MVKKHLDVEDLCVGLADTIREAAARMDKRHFGFVMVVDAKRKLVGTVTDGDLRRAFLARIPLDAAVSSLLERKKGTLFAKPVTASVSLSRAGCLALLRKHKIVHLPLVDARGRVTGLLTRDDLLSPDVLPINAVLMAGGKGSRLMPMTADTPKPMLRVGDKPLMEIIIGQLRDAGIKQIKVTTHHKHEKITEHFGDGRGFGIDLSYAYEDEPLGTAGALGLIKPPKDTLLVMNGDVLTRMDFRAMLRYHREMEADMTAAVCQYEFKIPYGVVETDGSLVKRLNEKPVMEFFVCAGIYMLEPAAIRAIPKGRRYDMTDLLNELLRRKRRVASFPIREYWLDIGRPDDFLRAQNEATAWVKGR